MVFIKVAFKGIAAVKDSKGGFIDKFLLLEKIVYKDSHVADVYRDDV